MPAWITALFAPVADIINKRQDRKIAREAANAKLAQARNDDVQEINLNKDEWEHLQVEGMSNTWKDEYVTVSIVSVLNLIVFGGIASAFGYPQILQGIGEAMVALSAAGVDMGFLMEAAVLAGLGLSIWKRF
jgi:hypothetical protein